MSDREKVTNKIIRRFFRRQTIHDAGDVLSIMIHDVNANDLSDDVDRERWIVLSDGVVREHLDRNRS